jgi:hypothetical protein
MTPRFFALQRSVVVALSGAAFTTAFALAAACGSSETPAAKGDPQAPVAQSAPPLKHEPCEDSMGQVDALDVNGDGKPDLKRIVNKASGQEVCRVADLNHDGKPELYSYYDASGQLRRREAMYEASDAISAIEYYEGGKLVRRELDTSGQRRVDVWDTFDPATGKRIKRERDTNGDGKVDQWWTWDGDKLTISMDKNGDGQPDPDATLVTGPNGQLVSLASLDAGLEGGPVTPAADAASQEGTSIKFPPPPVIYSAEVAWDGGGPPDAGKKKKGTK